MWPPPDQNEFHYFNQVHGCKCLAAYTGNNCTEDFDACQFFNPCDGQQCIDAKAPESGYICNITCKAGEERVNDSCLVIGEINSQISINCIGAASVMLLGNMP